MEAAEEALTDAEHDCDAHAVDWRERALDAEKRIANMTVAAAGALEVNIARITQLQAELDALREAVGALPEYAHTGDCPGAWDQEGYDGTNCTCGADAANAARAKARKLAGLG